jgi:beta-lactamase class A
MLKNISQNRLAIAIVFVIIGITIGFFVHQIYLQNPSSIDAYSVRQGGYTFINPLLSCDISEDKQFTEYQPIADKFKGYIDQHIANGDAQDISVYFRGLDSGRWSGVNENDVYSPASLLKVPLLIAWLKETDTNPSILNQQITYHQTTDGNAVETYKPKQFIEDGKTYSVNDLLRYMILYSDNNAAQLLQDNVNQNSLTDVYSDLGIPVSSSLSEDTITPKVYSYIFRVLYNATYLSKPMSQYALELLAPADFPGGIKGGIPSDVPSAQKFGERTVFNKDTTTGQTTLSFRELHDCGIVYYPHNPYLLCVMTKGQDFTKLSKIISDISGIVYKETASGVLKI